MIDYVLRKGYMQPEVCDKWIDFFDKFEKSDLITKFNNSRKILDYNHKEFLEKRKFTSLKFPLAREGSEHLRNSFNQCIDLTNKVNAEHWNFKIKNYRAAINRYSEGDLYTAHTDVAGLLARRSYNRSKSRPVDNNITAVVLLSDSKLCKGGKFQLLSCCYKVETEFDNFTKGDILIFPAYKAHAVTKITEGFRHSLTIWAKGPPLHKQVSGKKWLDRHGFRWV